MPPLLPDRLHTLLLGEGFLPAVLATTLLLDKEGNWGYNGSDLTCYRPPLSSISASSFNGGKRAETEESSSFEEAIEYGFICRRSKRKIYLHNFVYGLLIYWFGADFWDRIGLADEPFFFLLGIIVCPIGFLIGAVGSIVLFIRERKL